MSDFITREMRGNTTTTWLWNYDVDGALPRAEQEAFLRNDFFIEQIGRPEPIAIVGHTSRSGSERHNKDLAGRRAEAVMELLMANGIDPNRLRPIAFGERPNLPDVEENDKERGVRIITYDGTMALPTPPRPVHDAVCLPRPSNEMMYRLITNEPVAEQIHTQEILWIYVPDLLNILGPSGGGLGSQGVGLIGELTAMGNATWGLVTADAPNDPVRFENDEAAVLDAVWTRFEAKMIEEGLGWSEDYMLLNQDGHILRDPFAPRD